MKTIPQDTHFPRHPSSSMGKSSEDSDSTFSTLPRIRASFLWRQADFLGRIRYCPQTVRKSTFKAPRTSRPAFLCVPRSRGQTHHPSSPSSPEGTGSQPHRTALRTSSPTKPACRAFPRRYQRGHGKGKKYLGEAPRFPLSTSLEVHTPPHGG